MHIDSLPHVQHELHFLKQMLEEYATRYPEVARHVTRDPHVERLIQACALLAARIHVRLDDEFPEITEALLSLLYPHYLAPLPAMSVVQCVLNPSQGKPTSGYTLTSGTTLTARQDVRGVACRFRTCYPVTLWPLHVVSAHVGDPEGHHASAQGQQAKAMLTLTLRCADGLTFSELRMQHLRFYLHGSMPLAAALYETILCHTLQVQLRSPKAQGAQQTIYLSPHCLRPVGFGRDEGLLPYSPLSFLGYRLLQEYFTFPRKFLFFDLYELDRAAQAGCAEELEIRFMLRQPPQLAYPVDAENFRLGCTPMVNLFTQRAEPMRLDHRHSEYQVIPDVKHLDGTEVYAIDDVTSVSNYRDEPIHYAPFYSFKHASARKAQRAFWQAARRASPRQGDVGTDIFLRLVALDLQPVVPSVDTLIVRTTCTNRDRTRELRLGGEGGDFDLEGQQDVATMRALAPLTDPIRRPLRQSLQWRLIAHLGLNYVSVYDAGLEALQEILVLHDVANANQRQIEGITALQRQQVDRRLTSTDRHSFCTGTEVTLQCDEAKYAPGEIFLFASVLEHFFGLCAPLNSFSQLVVTTDQRMAQEQEPLNIWSPRAGEQVLRT